LVAQLKTVWTPVTISISKDTLVTKRPNYQKLNPHVSGDTWGFFCISQNGVLFFLKTTLVKDRNSKQNFSLQGCSL
jgi:hypothetical protein